jgi:hypothetical protein
MSTYLAETKCAVNAQRTRLDAEHLMFADNPSATNFGNMLAAMMSYQLAVTNAREAEIESREGIERI